MDHNIVVDIHVIDVHGGPISSLAGFLPSGLLWIFGVGFFGGGQILLGAVGIGRRLSIPLWDMRPGLGLSSGRFSVDRGFLF